MTVAYYVLPELRRSMHSGAGYLQADGRGKFAVTVGSADETALIAHGALLADSKGQLVGSDPATVLSEVQATVVAAAVAAVTFAPLATTVLVGAAIDLTVSGTAYEVGHVALGAGTWDVDGFVGFLPAAATSITGLAGSTSVATAQIVSGQGFVLRQAAIIPGAVAIEFPVVTVRYVLASPASVYLNASAVFTVSTIAAYGRIQARKVIA